MAQSLSEASGAASRQAQIDALDNIGSDQDLFTAALTPIEDAAAAFVERIKLNIEQAKMIVTGAIDNISISPNEDGGVSVYGPLHLIFQDKGVNGSVSKPYVTPFSYKDKPPPWQVFKAWAETKNLQLRNESKMNKKKDGSPFKEYTKDEQLEKLARAIAMNVFKNGLKPRNVYSKEIPKLVEDIAALVPGFVASQVVEIIGAIPPPEVNVNL